MEMNIVIVLLLGLLVGGFLGYFILKSSILKNYISKTDYDKLISELNELRIETAKKLTKQEVENGYVVKELYDSLVLNLENKEKDIENNYVAKESFDIINKKLIITDNSLAEANQKILELTTQLAEYKKDEESLNEKITTFKSEIEKLHTLSQEQFKNLASDIIKEKSKDFVDTNKTSLDTILNPLKTDISNFKKTIEDTRKEDIQDLTSLKKEIESLQKLNSQLSEDAQGLASALKSDVRIQGNWGEDRLKLILEAEGLQKYIDFTSQSAYKDEEEEINRKPDYILNLPDGKHLIIDSKVSLKAYIDYFNSTNPDDKKSYLKQLVKSITDHIDLLASKNYQSLVGLNTPDFVFMFMHFESALTLALNENPDIFNRALSKKIVIITPTTLVATAKVVKLLWQKENRVKNVEEIFKQCGLLYDKFVLFIEELQKIGSSLSSASEAYKEAIDRLKDGKRKGDTIIGRFETIRKLEARVSKRIPNNLLAEIELLEDEPEVKMLPENEMNTEEQN